MFESVSFQLKRCSPDPSSDPDAKAAFTQNSARPVSLSPNEESTLSASPSADLQDYGTLSDYPRTFGPLPASLISSKPPSTLLNYVSAGHQRRKVPAGERLAHAQDSSNTGVRTRIHTHLDVP
jgi:hypothetical protein